MTGHEKGTSPNPPPIFVSVVLSDGPKCGVETGKDRPTRTRFLNLGYPRCSRSQSHPLSTLWFNPSNLPHKYLLVKFLHPPRTPFVSAVTSLCPGRHNLDRGRDPVFLVPLSLRRLGTRLSSTQESTPLGLSVAVEHPSFGPIAHVQE